MGNNPEQNILRNTLYDRLVGGVSGLPWLAEIADLASLGTHLQAEIPACTAPSSTSAARTWADPCSLSFSKLKLTLLLVRPQHP